MSEQPETLGKYQIQTVLGKGKMGIVYLGLDPDINRKVAIKVLHPHLCEGEAGEDFVRRFRREAQAAARSFHTNIVTVFELGKHGDTDFIVMEYVQGEELQEALDGGYLFSEEEVIFIAISILKALDTAHANGIVHRDIKPANILLMDDGNVKVADFGVAKLDRLDLTMQGNAVGTPSYMSPESLKGKTVTHLTDIYSLGAVMLQMLTGKRLTADKLYPLKLNEFMAEVLAGDRAKQVSPKLMSLVVKAMSEKPELRPRTSCSFYNELEKIAKSNATGLACDDETQQKLVNILMAYLGPIAPVLLKQTLSKVKTYEDLALRLSQAVDDTVEQEELLVKVQKVLKRLSITNDAKFTGDQPLSCDESIQEQLVLILKPYLGPIAPVLLKQGLAKANDNDSLLLTLSAAIEDEQESQAFLERARAVFPSQ